MTPRPPHRGGLLAIALTILLGALLSFPTFRASNAQAPAAEQNVLRYDFAVEKQGCRVISFISPQKTAETQKAIEEQAQALRGRGYKTLLLTQDKQARGDWKDIIENGAAGNDYILIDAAAGVGYDCAAPAAYSDGVTLLIDQKRTKLKELKATRQIIDTARLKTLSAVVVNVKDEFVI